MSDFLLYSNTIISNFEFHWSGTCSQFHPFYFKIQNLGSKVRIKKDCMSFYIITCIKYFKYFLGHSIFKWTSASASASASASRSAANNWDSCQENQRGTVYGNNQDSCQENVFTLKTWLLGTIKIPVRKVCSRWKHCLPEQLRLLSGKCVHAENAAYQNNRDSCQCQENVLTLKTWLMGTIKIPVRRVCSYWKHSLPEQSRFLSGKCVYAEMWLMGRIKITVRKMCSRWKYGLWEQWRFLSVFNGLICSLLRVFICSAVLLCCRFSAASVVFHVYVHVNSWSNHNKPINHPPFNHYLCQGFHRLFHHLMNVCLLDQWVAHPPSSLLHL